MYNHIYSYIQALTLADYIIIGLFLLIGLFRFIVTTLFYGRLATVRVAPAGTSSLPVTVVMVERNEEANLKKNLPDWLKMGYPSYEVLVVDDFSEDNSLAELGILKSSNPRLKITSLNQETRYSSKLARNLALKAASHDIVVMADPSCIVPDNHWLPGISAAIVKGKDVVLGYCNLYPGSGFDHHVYRAESFYQQLESMACSITRMPFVTAEENVAFKKQSYFDLGGLAGKIKEEYLNFELIVNKIIRPGKVAVLPVGNLSMRKTVNIDRLDLRDLFFKSFRLKNHLKPFIRIFLLILHFSAFLILPAFVTLLVIYPVLALPLAGLALLKLIIHIFILFRIQKRLFEHKLFVISLIYGLIRPYYRWMMKRQYIRTSIKR
jgi:glycosyltransferase involved in cell wall biosynthesis